MKKNISITMFEVVGSSLCVASGDGQKVYDRIPGRLKKDVMSPSPFAT